MNKKILFPISIVFVLAAVAVVFFSVSPKVTETTTQTQSIRPEFSLPDLQGQLRNINEWDGKYIVLNFWGTWCPPCRKEIPEFIAMQEEYGASNLQFIGVAIDSDAPVMQFALETGMNYPNLIAKIQGLELAKKYGNVAGALPFSVIINPESQIIARQVGLLERDKILKFTQLTD